MRVLATIAFSFAAATLAATMLPWNGWQLYCAGALLVPALVLLVFRTAFPKKKYLRLRLLLILFSAAVSLLWHSGYHALIVAPVEERCGQIQDFSGTVAEYPIATEKGMKVTLLLGRGAKGVYYGDASLLTLQPGEKLSGSAYWQSAARIREQEITTFTSRGVYVLLYGRDEPRIESGSRGSLRWLPQLTARTVQEKVSQIWRDDTTAAFAMAMLTGERAGLSVEEETAVSEVGLSHLFAVSGLHCTFLISLLGILLPKGRRRLFAAVSIAVLCFYMLVVGLTPSVIRSCIMLIMVLLAPLFLRDSDPLTGMGTALLLILLCNPYACGSISLQLSFAATAGMLLCAERLYRWMMCLPVKNGLLRKGWSALAASASASVGAMVFTAPLTAFYFNIFALIAPLSNLLVVPVAAAAFMVSFAAVLLSFLWLPGAQLIGWAVWGMVRYVLWIARGLMQIPFHAVYFSNTYLKYWLVYAYAAFGACVFTRDRKRKFVIAGVLVSLTLVLTVWLGALQYRYADLSVLAVDVGQGESVVLRSGEETILVDCGSSNSYISAGGRAADELSSMGVRRLTAVAVTHYHADHTNGLYELFSRIPVQTLYLPRIEDEYGVKDRLLELAERYDTAVRYVEEVTTCSLGDSTLQIYPPLGEGDLNEQGLTVLCSAGDFDVLITGDMAGSTEEKLIAAYDLPDIEALLVSHHGSKYSTDRIFLQEVRPEVAIISVGDNSYGHPSDVVLGRLAVQGIDVYRTDQQGNVLLSVHKGEE